MSRILEKSQIEEFIKSFNHFDELPCGVIAFSPEGRVYQVNKTLSEWVGIPKSAIIDQGFKSLVTKASLLYYNLMLEPMLNLNAEVNEINLQLNGLSGKIEVLMNAAIYRNSEDQAVLVQATFQRITHRKEYELELLMEKRMAEQQQRKFEFVFNLVPIQIWTADPAGNVLSINQKVLDYFGSMELSDAGAFSGVYIADREKALREWTKAIRTGGRYEREMRFLGTSAEPEWFLVKGEPFYDVDGEIDMWFCCSVNINKQKLLQLANQQELTQNLRSAYESLDKNEKLFSAIAMSQSHMVRKPLANIIALMTLLKAEPDIQQASDLMDLLSQSVEELDQMIKKVTTGIGE